MTEQTETPPMTEVREFERSHEEACAKEGHLMHEDETGKFCLRCPYTKGGG